MITKPPRYNPEHVGERDTADPRYRSNERVPFEFKRWTDPAVTRGGQKGRIHVGLRWAL